jgi:prolyl-tRNA synthetase
MSKDAGEKKKEPSRGKHPDREDLGITVRKQDDFSEWYTQVVLKAELADYASGKGFIVLRPNGYDLWEQIKQYFDAIIKKTGHRNAYFPTLIPESLLKKESEHFAGFVPEAYWVTYAGTQELSDRYAVRPTSETIIHDSMSRWIRSWRDLPMLLNVWNSVLRAEIKSTKPLIRSSEFLWQEGHTAHATEQEAKKEIMEILLAYREVMQDLLAIPVYIGKKSDRETFVGAVYTTTLEAMMPDGRAVQMGTSHFLGQNFSRPFEIRFLDKDSELRFVWQTSWGISWRTIGAMVMEHGDDKGLVLPPKAAPVQAVIVPIIFSSGKAAGVLEKCHEIEGELSNGGMRSMVDSRDNYTPGWKFNEWEMKGIPIRIEVGPRDLANNTAVLVRRDTGSKSTIKTSEIVQTTKMLLKEIQENLWDQASKRLKGQTVTVSSYQDLKSALEKGGFVKAPWCGSPECEVKVKDETGADIRLIPFDEKPEANSSCVVCEKAATQIAYFARAY